MVNDHVLYQVIILPDDFRFTTRLDVRYVNA